MKIANLSKSTYEYAIKHAEKPEKLDEIRIKDEIKVIYKKSKKRYGYRKITTVLRSEYGEKNNHKRVLRLMNELGIYAILSGHEKGYSSYRGSVGKVAPNLMKRDFHAAASYQKAGTDVTEFKCDWGKAYFSPIIDFHNDEILGFSISKSPNMKMISSMLNMLYNITS